MMIKKIIKQVYLKVKKMMINEFEFLPSKTWTQKELLAEEFKSIRFLYI